MDNKRQKFFKILKIISGAIPLVFLFITYALFFILDQKDFYVILIFLILSLFSLIVFLILRKIPFKITRKEKIKVKKMSSNQVTVEHIKPVIKTKAPEAAKNNEVKEIETKSIYNKGRNVDSKLLFYRIISGALLATLLIILAINIFKTDKTEYLDKMEFTFLSMSTEYVEDNNPDEFRLMMKFGIYNNNNYDVDIYAEKFDLKMYSLSSGGYILNPIDFKFHFSTLDSREKVCIKNKSYFELEIITQTISNQVNQLIESPSVVGLAYENIIFLLWKVGA